MVEEHQVLTLGTRNMTWRMAECGIPHSFPREEGLCINGVLYYTAVSSSVRMLVCFDVRSEKYSFVKPPEGGMFKLINFQGKLASVSEDISRVEIQGIEAFKKDSEAHVILNHVEDAKIMELF
ncbi:hypothetical protein HID58_068839 [Brassica napus]|uniref:F-box associated beta-propeller type 3 domain-containing protein n=1 Tax=Brassica napus TaxID=3708 RepID=A0ABQ7ZMF9_BRANA|nr:hypothetical protein HID58_068839 [Brassica napus]